MWEVGGIVKEPGLFGPFEPKDVLIWYDGPRTFTLLDADGGLCLAHWLDEDNEVMRYAVAPITPRHLEQLRRGELTLREGLDQPRVYVVDQANDGAICNVWLTRLADLPQDALPVQGTMLSRELEPFLSLRATGEAIRPGEIPGSVIRNTVEGAQRAIKCLAEYEMGILERRGQPSRALKELYDLPAQKLLAASFEVQFRSPLTEPGLFDGLPPDEVAVERGVLDRVGNHLRTGLAWLQRTPATPADQPVPEDQELSRVIVEAVKHLTPPTRGPIEAMEVRGEVVRQVVPVRLTRANRRRVIESEKRNTAEFQFKRAKLQGTIINILGETAQILVEFDLEDGGTSQRLCQLSEEIWEETGESLHFNQPIELWGFDHGPRFPLRVMAIL
jgi:hypothetical protein